MVNISKKYLASTARGFDSPKVHLTIDDGFTFLRHFANGSEDEKFDVIITDSSDPVGPGVALFEKPYFQLLKEALRPPYGIICNMGVLTSFHLHIHV